MARDSSDLHAHIAYGLPSHNVNAGSVTRVGRMALMARPAGPGAGEITDKATSTSARSSPGALI